MILFCSSFHEQEEPDEESSNSNDAIEGKEAKAQMDSGAPEFNRKSQLRALIEKSLLLQGRQYKYLIDLHILVLHFLQ